MSSFLIHPHWWPRFQHMNLCGALNPDPNPDSWDSDSCLQGLCYFFQFFLGFPLESSGFDSCSYSWSFSGFEKCFHASWLFLAISHEWKWWISSSEFCVFDLLLGDIALLKLMAILNNCNYKHSTSKARTGHIDLHIEMHSHYHHLGTGGGGECTGYKVDAHLKLFWGTLSS